MCNCFELPCRDGRKSFYGKALVKMDDVGIHLYSYGTHVCSIVLENGEMFPRPVFERYWSGYSATTMRHINAFVATFGGLYGIRGGGKAWWDSLEVV